MLNKKVGLASITKWRFDMPQVSGISDTLAEIKRANNAAKRAKAERDELNEIAKKQRVEIRRLKTLLEKAYHLIPNYSHGVNDKIIEQIDAALHTEES
jgi:hypothetical protein